MIKDLNWNNYLELNEFIKTNNYKSNFFSIIQFMQWEFYGSKFKYRKVNDCIIFYTKPSANENWKVISPFYLTNVDIEKNILIIKQDLKELNNNDEINFIEINDEFIKDWEFEDKNKTLSPITTNYIYELNQLKTFSGNKMQKKRNHLNYFLKQNHNISIKNIRDVTVDDLIIFTEHLIRKYDDEVRDNEINNYRFILENEIKKTNRYNGICIFINNQLVAYTLGFDNYDTYEIIIEKAERDIRGLFQYVIKTNLETNNINTKYIDRLDDLGLESLAKSKLSYCPIVAIRRYNIKY